MAIAPDVEGETMRRELRDSEDGGSSFNRKDSEKRLTRRSSCKFYLAAGAALMVGAILCVLGVMFASRTGRAAEERNRSCSSGTDPRSACAFSAEARRIQLPEFLDKVKKVYYELNADSLAWESGVEDEQLKENVKERYMPYETHPLKLKEKTDKSLSLLAEINSKNVDSDKLKPREMKALDQLKHFLRHNFGVPYDEHYYNGDWMMGPNHFCWQPFCDIHAKLYAYSYFAAPSSFRELENVIQRIMSHKISIDRYRMNIELGVKTGMVRSIEDCLSGVNAMKEGLGQFTQTNSSENVLKEEYTALFQAEKFLHHVPKEDVQLWSIRKKKTPSQSIKEALVEGFGKPLLYLIHYLENDHLRHCLPSDVSSGLVSLPVDFVYYDGKPTSQQTTKVLPTGERLDGRESYGRIISYFTTTDITAEKIYRKGKKQTDLFYSEILKIAKSITNTTSNTKAVKTLRKFLNLDSHWHNEEPFPANESDSAAFKTCVDEQSAKLYCPVRYATMEKWKASCREIMARIHPQFIHAFHITGKRVTLPNCPIEIQPHFNPSGGTMFFKESDEWCSQPTVFQLPFFLQRYGPKFQEWSVVAHETRPGHHSQAQGLKEYFHSNCGGVMAWLNDQNRFPVFSEGWALYSENPVMSDDTELYNDNPIQKYGMLKWQLWRALRLIIDTGLHQRGMKRSEALDLFAKFAWDKTDFAVKELTRYQSCPGQATAYMIGRLTIMDLRMQAKKELGEKFDLKDFHYHVLSQGNAPLSFLRKYIGKYIECTKKDSNTGFCKSIAESHNQEGEFNAGHQGMKLRRAFQKPLRRHHL